MTVAERFEGDLPIQTAETAAERVPQRAVLATSGFGSVGYPKAVPEAIAAADGERADLILEAAHREYRPALSEYRERAADGGGHVPHDLETALSWSGDRRQELSRREDADHRSGAVPWPRPLPALRECSSPPTGRPREPGGRRYRSPPW